MGNGKESPTFQSYFAPAPTREHLQPAGRREPDHGPVRQLERGRLGLRRRDLPYAQPWRSGGLAAQLCVGEATRNHHDGRRRRREPRHSGPRESAAQRNHPRPKPTRRDQLGS